MTEFTNVISSSCVIRLTISIASSKLPPIWITLAPCIISWASFPTDILPDGITTKSPDQIQSEQLNTELQSIRNEIQTKNEQLDSLNAKLVIAKKEYEEVISEIMSSKKQVNQAKKDLEEYTSKLDSTRKENND